MSCINKDVAIVVGHTKQSKGACSPFGIPCEWDFNNKVCSYLSNVADIYCYNSYAKGYTGMVKENAALLNKKNYKLVIELHYNAASPLANGCEVLYYFASVKGKEYAVEASKMISEEFKVTNRGAKPLVKSSDRGFAAVYYPKAPAIIFEPFFGSNKEDSSKFIGKEKEYAVFIEKFINKILKR